MVDAVSRAGERRHVTVMFADVSGFTAMARGMDPEDVTEVMNSCFAVLEQAVVEHGGHVDKYIGDCVMALFGAPVAIEDAPRQAVNAAIVILEQVARFAAARGLEGRIDVHIGINTGLVLYGEVGGALSHETTAMGDTVNIAARLRDASSPGVVLLGPQTRHETVGDFHCRKVTGLRMKGVEGTFEAWELVSREPRYHRSFARQPGAEPFSPLVGRAAELAALSDAARGLAGGRGRIVAVTGEAGLGKSRLLFEMRRLEAFAGAVFLEGRALRLGDATGLSALADLLRAWSGVDRRASGEAARLRVRDAVVAAMGDEAADTWPFLATLAALPPGDAEESRLEGIDPEGLARLMALALRDLLECLAARGPVVVVLDDLHWADPSTVELLRRVLDLARRRPVLFVLAYRPDADRPSAALDADLDGTWRDVATRLPLLRLGEKESIALLRERIHLDDRPDRTRRAILSRAEGNPFFIEEIIRSLIDVGAIRHEPGGLVVTERIDEVEVPGTVQELMMDRVDRLPPGRREVLQSASVVGRSFLGRVLEEVVEARDGLDEALAQIVDRGFIESVPQVTGSDFAFRHALAHETVYEGILKRRRRDLHGEVARGIERLFAGGLRDHYASLAYHYSRAEEWEKASVYLVEAGDEAARAASSSEALRYFAEAAAIHEKLHGRGGRAAERAAIERKIGLACLARGDLPTALDHIDRALALLGYAVPTSGPAMAVRLVADVAAIVCQSFVRPWLPARRRPPERVVEVSELCFHKGKAQSTTAPQGYVLSLLPAVRAMGAWDVRDVPHACAVMAAGAALFAWSGLSFRLARRMSAAAASHVRTVPDSVVQGTMRFVVHYLEGDWSEAVTLPQSVVEDGLRYGEFWEVNTYLGLHCERRIHQGRLAEAARVLLGIDELLDRYGYEFAVTNAWAMRTYLALASGRLAEAGVAASRYYDACNEEPLNLLALALRARIEVAGGRLDEAGTTLEEAGRLADVLGRQAAPYHLAPLQVARLELVAARMEAEGGRGVSALEREARAILRDAASAAAGVARDRPACECAAARIDWAVGRRRRALRRWSVAARDAEARDALPDLARVYREAGQRLQSASLDARPCGLDATQMMAEAARVERELDAGWQEAIALLGGSWSRP